MAKIFVTRELPGNRLEDWSQHHDIRIFRETRPITKEELLQEIEDIDVLVSLLGDKIDQDIILASKKLCIIANYAVGYNNIDVVFASQQKIRVLNTPGVLTDATAELAFALMLSASRRLGEGERLVRSKTWDGWAPQQLLGPQVTGKTVGIVGMGRIGRSFAKMAKGFSMKILYNNRNRLPIAVERELGATFVSLEELLSLSDVVSLHCPLTSETKHLIDEKALSKMKKNSVLINTARGPVVKEQALVDALKSKHLFAAGLDVFEEEPTIHPALFELENVVMLPHIGTASVEARDAMLELVISGVEDVLADKIPSNCVNAKDF